GARLVRLVAPHGVEGTGKVYLQDRVAGEIAAARQRDARGIECGPVMLLDHYDNCASGGTMDTMAVLGAILEAGLEDVAAFAVCDPQAVEQMKRAGVGARVTLPLGGKLDMPALGLKGKPLTVTGNVRRIVSGIYRN